jgi:PAS domain S-box-containing protein
MYKKKLMKFKNLTFRTKILRGFITVIVIMVVLTLFEILQINSLRNRTELIYEHPFAVSNAAKNIKIHILENIYHLLKMRDLDEFTKIDSIKELINRNDELIVYNFQTVHNQYLGNMSEVDSAFQYYNKWKIFENRIFLLHHENKTDSLNILIESGSSVEVGEMFYYVTKISDFADNKAKTTFENVIKIEKQAYYISIIVLIFTSLVILIFSHLISKSITEPIVRFIKETKEIILKQSENDAVEFINEKELLFYTLNELKLSYQNIEQQNEEIKDINERLSENNELLEVKVKDRTIKLEQYNEEIITQNEEIAKQNIEYRKINEELMKLKRAVEFNPASIVITDKNGQIEYVNPKFSELTGYTFEEAIGKNQRILSSGETPTDLYKDLWNTILSKNNWKGEILNKNKNDEFYWESILISPIKNPEGEITHFVAVKEDITDRKKNEKLIQEKKAELEDLNATKDKFFSIIAHDLKNPFSAILGFSELLQNNCHEYDSGKIIRFATTINTAANQTYRLLENLLEWSRLQRNLVTPYLRRCNLKSIVSEVVMANNALAHNKNISLQNNILSDIYVNCDTNMTHTVLRNLISNAIKFTNTNGSVNIYAHENEVNTEIQIKDSGVGISSENLIHIFRIEKNVSTLGTANEKGTGLGLLLCKELIEKQGGKIWVESKVNEGTTFYFTLKKNNEGN